MVGLSIILESGLNNHKGNTTTNKKNHPQVINKATMVKKTSTSTPPPPPLQPSHPSSRRTFPASYLPAAAFLDQCYLCSQKLLPSKDIYMYKGDRAFCSVECRCRQIIMDEEEITAALYNNKRNTCSSATASSSRAHKGARNRANEFAY